MEPVNTNVGIVLDDTDIRKGTRYLCSRCDNEVFVPTKKKIKNHKGRYFMVENGCFRY